MKPRSILSQCLLLLLIPLCLPYAPAQASSDYCDDVPGYGAINQAYATPTACRSSALSMAMLSPGNDTRVNLMLLMADMHGVPSAAKADSDNPPQFGFDEFRERLFPRPQAGDPEHPAPDAFSIAVTRETGLPSSERDLLIARRTDPAAASQIHSATGKAYLRYLRAAASFYDEDYQRAASDFAALAGTDAPWLRETALYMVARSAVRALQPGSAFDEYGDIKQGWRADPAQVAEANTALTAYLAAWPKGLYANSARGLQRRVSWLAGDRVGLAAGYARAIAQDRAARNVDDGELAQEIDSKLLFAPDGRYYENGIPMSPVDTTDPALLAVVDLYQMRQTPPGAESPPGRILLTRAALLAQRIHFEQTQPAGKDLFDFLLAAHAFYVERKVDETLALIPEEAGQTRFSYLQFSRQMLRGLALQAQGGKEQERAREHYVNMLPGAVLPSQRSALELAIALIDQNSKQVARIFAADSPVRNQAIRGLALSYHADAPLLRKQAQDNGIARDERETALFVLLYKQLTRGFYADYLRDLALMPADVATTSKASKALNYLPGFGPEARPITPDPESSAEYNAQWRQPLGVFVTPVKPDNAYACPALKAIATTLAGNVSHVRAKMCLAEFMRLKGFDWFTVLDTPRDARQSYSRLTTYRSVIADTEASSGDKAYALYRAVHCYGPGGNNSCGGEEAAPAQRKAWFMQLKKDYPKSPWARKLQYYW